MNKNILGIIIAVVAVAGIIGVVMANKPDEAKTPATSQSTNTANDMAGMEDANQNANTDASGTEDLTGQTEVTMDIKDFAFAQKEIKISKGTKVTWTNQDQARHNVFSKDAGGPQGELLDKGQSFSFTFDTIGTFNYLCEPHPYMKAVVNVV